MFNTPRQEPQFAAMRHQGTAAFARHGDIEHDEVSEIDELLNVPRADVERPLHAIRISEGAAARGAQPERNFGGGKHGLRPRTQREEVRAENKLIADLTSAINNLKRLRGHIVPGRLISGG